VRRRIRLAGLAAVVVAAGVALAAPPRAHTAPPAIGAPQAILVAPASGDVLFSREVHASRPVASATKLMTALVVLERVSLRDSFIAGDYRPISSAETRLGLRAGERMNVADLLRGLLLGSANDAAQTLARGTAGSTGSFVALMNRRARELGLRDTHFANPIGLDEPGNYSSAADLTRLTARLRRNRFFARTVAMPRVRLQSGSRPRVVDNRNDLVGSRPFVNGVKTGHTLGAGYVLVGSASRGPVTVISVVLGERSESARDADTVALLDYGLQQFRSVRIVRAGQVLSSAAVRHRRGDRIRLRAAREVTRALRRGDRAVVSVDAPRELEGPLPAGARVGAALVIVRGRVVARVPLLTAAPVPAARPLDRLADALDRPGTLAVVVAAAALAGLAAVGRRRYMRRHRSKAARP
jgi:serine-type D-Ala-D-Ala carboxypeptidase (penicillin-binding protein 5/6)